MGGRQFGPKQMIEERHDYWMLTRPGRALDKPKYVYTCPPMTEDEAKAHYSWAIVTRATKEEWMRGAGND